MALVHASETASFRSSTRSSPMPGVALARADTSRRATATNSGRAGISSSTNSPLIIPGSKTPWAVLPFGHGGVERVVDGEHLRQTRDLEDLQDAALGADQHQVAVMAAEPLQPAHQHAKAGGVEEVDGLEVDDDAVLSLADQLDEALAEAGSRVDVHLTAHRENCPTVAFTYLETEIHGLPPTSGPGRSNLPTGTAHTALVAIEDVLRAAAEHDQLVHVELLSARTARIGHLGQQLNPDVERLVPTAGL